MLLKKLRLNTEAFNTVFEQGKNQQTEHFQARFLAISGSASPVSQSRFAVVVSKKNIKTAVGRNRLRRRIYTALAHYSFSGKQQFTVVMMTKKNLEKLEARELNGAVQSLLEKIAPVHYT